MRLRATHRAVRRPSTTVLATFASLGALLATLLVVPAGAASLPESRKIARSASLDLVGHGYGHGHGMSQFGAQGMALQNNNWAEILRFYYPGTRFAEFHGWVKVRITADDDNRLMVRPRSGLKVRDLATHKTYTLPANGATAWRFNRLGGEVQLAYRTDRWRQYRVEPGMPTLKGVGQFLAPGPVTLVLPDGAERPYRGFLRYHHADTINYLPMDDYLKGVVPAEMPASWLRAALRAQVVAARTYAIFERSQRLGRYWELCDTTACQVYGGVDAEQARTNEAIELTPARYLTYGGQPAFTQFHSSSGGWTAAGGKPYLPAKADPYDDYARNYNHTWQTSVPAAAVERAYPSVGRFVRVRILKRDGNGSWGGRVVAARVVGTDGNVVVSGTDLRFALGLKSNWFRNA